MQIEFFIAALVAAATAAIFYFGVPRAWSWLQHHKPVDPDVRRRFNNVYAMSTQERREAIIKFYMKRDSSSREQAMRSATGDNRSDRDRWL